MGEEDWVGAHESAGGVASARGVEMTGASGRRKGLFALKLSAREKREPGDAIGQRAGGTKRRRRRRVPVGHALQGGDGGGQHVLERAALVRLVQGLVDVHHVVLAALAVLLRRVRREGEKGGGGKGGV